MRSKIKPVMIIPLIFIVVIVSGFIPYGKVLAVQYENSGHLMAFINLNEEKQFKIRYIHSVHRTPVTESYSINRQDDIVQTELAYEHFAIGMPSNAIGDEKFTEKNGVYYIKNMHRVFSYVDVRTGQVISNHTLIIGTHSKPFNDFIQPGTWIRIVVKPLSFWQRLRGDEVFG